MYTQTMEAYGPFQKSNERMCVYANVFANNNKFSLLARHFGQQNSVSVIISNLTLFLECVYMFVCDWERVCVRCLTFKICLFHWSPKLSQMYLMADHKEARARVQTIHTCVYGIKI